MIGNSPAVAALPPLHEIVFTGPCPGAGSLEFAVNVASASLEFPPYLAAARAVVISRSTAQIKPASSRATAVMATVLSLPLRISAR